MAQFSLSPSVAVKETDLAKIVPSVATAIGAYAGTFTWGPAFEIVNITSEDSLTTSFGKPKDENATDWFCAQDYLSYSSYLKTVRVVNAAARNAVAKTTAILVKNETDFSSQGGTGSATLQSKGAIAKYPGELGNGLEVSFVDADTFANWKYRELFSSATVATISERVTALVGTATSTLGSNLLTNVTITSGAIAVGQPINHAGVSPGTKVLEIMNSNTIKMDANATSSVTGSALTTVLAFSITGNTTSGSKTVSNIAVVSGALAVGQTFVGVGIPDGTKITSITNATTVVLSNAATVTDSVVSFTGTVDGLVEFISTWPGAPGTSTFCKSQGGANDEIHLVIVDKLGEFSGTKGTILEKYTGLSKASNGKTQEGAANYYITVINDNSKYIWLTDIETPVQASVEHGGGTAAFGLDASNKFGSLSHQEIYSLSGGLSGNSSVTDADRVAGFAMFRNQEEVDITLVVGGVTSDTIARYISDQLCTYRKDCVGGVSPPLAAVYNNAGNEERDVLKFRNNLNSTSYIVCDTGWKEVYDRYNDKYRFIPLNPSIIGLMAQVDVTNDTWWSPAGFNRGFIKNVVRLLWNPTSKAVRDNLYQVGINPVVTFPGVGTVLYGDKTMVTDQGPFSRINVRRLFILLEKALASYSKFVLFEFNDAFTRTRFSNTVTPYLRDIQGRRGIYDFKVISDDTVNTTEVIDSNGFRAKFLIKPSRSINFIELEFVATATGANFTELA